MALDERWVDQDCEMVDAGEGHVNSAPLPANFYRSMPLIIACDPQQKE
jgi:hypothetical protein